MSEAKLVAVRQYPLRMNIHLSNRLDDVSDATGIPKSTILRMGLTHVLNELESSGVLNTMGNIRKTR